jgi:hypothetical protein
MARLHVLAIELCLELAHLFVAELHHFVLTTRIGLGLLS